MSVAVWSLASAVGVSLLALSGRVVLVGQLHKRREALLRGLVSLAVGALLGGALIHLIPRSIQAHGGPSVQVMLLVVVGFLGFFLLEKTFHAHHRHPGSPRHPDDGETGGDGAASDGAARGPRWIQRLAGRKVRPIVPMLLAGDSVHNFVDGAVLVAAYSVGVEFGLITTLAIALHEVAQEVGDFGALVHGGLAPRRALLLNLASAGFAVVGVAFALVLSAAVQDLEAVLLPLAAGNFLYIAASDLVPQLHREGTVREAWSQGVVISAGVAAMVAIRVLRETLT